MKLQRDAHELVDLRRRAVRHHALAFINANPTETELFHTITSNLHEASGRLLDALSDEAEG